MIVQLVRLPSRVRLLVCLVRLRSSSSVPSICSSTHLLVRLLVHLARLQKFLAFARLQSRARLHLTASSVPNMSPARPLASQAFRSPLFACLSLSRSNRCTLLLDVGLTACVGQGVADQVGI